MQRSKVWKIVLILVPLLIFSSFIGVFELFDSNDIKINRYDAIIDVNENGDMKVVETWDMHYDGDYRVRFRDINYRKYPNDYPLVMDEDNRASFDETSVNVRVWKNDVEVTNTVRLGYSFLNEFDELGERITCEPASFTCESLFVDFGSAGAMSGHVVFKYEYTILGAMTKYSNITELNWKLFDYMEADIDEANVTINLPSNSYAVNQFFLFYHGKQDYQVDLISNTQLKLKVLEMNQNDFLEFRMLAPNPIFPNISNDHTVTDDLMTLSYLLGYEEGLRLSYERQLATEKSLNLGLIILAPTMLIIALFSYFIFDKEHPKYEVNKYIFDLPSDDTPAEIGYLFHMQKVGDEDITATLLDLIRKGYINIDSFEEASKTKDHGYMLLRVRDMDESKLLSHEKHVLTWFFDRIGNGTYVSTDEIEHYGSTSYEAASSFTQEAKNFVSLVKAQGQTKDYFDSPRSKGRRLIKFLGLIPLIFATISVMLGVIYDANTTLALIVSLVIGVIYYIYVLSIKRRSIKGHELYLKWDAFKRYLRDFEGLENFTIPSVETWEHYLVYATTFKMAKSVMDQFRIKVSKLDGEHLDHYNRYYNYGLMTNRFNHVLYTSRMYVNKTISAHSSSSSGGSSGGGGGGGRSR